MITITDQTLDIQKIIQSAANPGAGAINVFIGTVRNKFEEKTVTRLEYESYPEMATPEIEKIAEVAIARWPVLGYAISHRTGVLAPGETAVVVAVATPHRKESFAACEFIINELKAKAPIWKKEVYEDSEIWVDVNPKK